MPAGAALPALLEDFSIEVMPKTAAKVEDFRAILPEGTRVYLAHIDGTDFAEMLATARRLVDEGFAVMPHFPARGIATRAELAARIAAYADVGVTARAGDRRRHRHARAATITRRSSCSGPASSTRPASPSSTSPATPRATATSTRRAATPPAWRRSVAKDAFQRETDAAMAIATQFCFEAAPVIPGPTGSRAAGIALPVHIGVAGPAKLQTMLKFAMACGVGPSLRVLQRRAADLTKLMLPFEPTDS